MRTTIIRVLFAYNDPSNELRFGCLHLTTGNLQIIQWDDGHIDGYVSMDLVNEYIKAYQLYLSRS